MHIEPGLIVASKLVLANASAIGVLSFYLKAVLNRPGDIIRTLLAALFFSLFMQSVHVNVGPSELHFVGAIVIYLTLGFLPTLLGFAVGLLLQGLLFDAADLPNLAVNSLSLIVPLMAVHYGLGRRLRKEQTGTVNLKSLVMLDAIYYTGVTAMVGFWLSISEVSTPLTAWAAFASSYLIIVVVEPFISWGALRLLNRFQHRKLVSICFAVPTKAQV